MSPEFVFCRTGEAAVRLSPDERAVVMLACQARGHAGYERWSDRDERRFLLRKTVAGLELLTAFPGASDALRLTIGSRLPDLPLSDELRELVIESYQNLLAGFDWSMLDATARSLPSGP